MPLNSLGRRSSATAIGALGNSGRVSEATTARITDYARRVIASIGG